MRDNNARGSLRRVPLPAILYILAFLVAGCATQRTPVVVVDYSDERSILYEVEQARKVLDQDPVLALARARALKDNSKSMDQVENLYSDAGDRARAEFDKSIAAGLWVDALRIYKSLDVLSMPPSGWDEIKIQEQRLRAWREEGNTTLIALDQVLKSTPEDEAPSSGIVSRMIKGTITVWVDRGLTVKNGVGYADRVIGSGFFIDKRGYLVTNYHVIASEVDPKYEGYSRLFLKLPSDPDTRIPARVIGWDPVFDLALLKTEIEPPAVFQLGTSEDLKVGNRIYAIGSPAGLEQTLTSGIVSAQKRRLLSLGDILQIDAPINHGNSGGPIVDEAGRVQAVVFAGIEPYEGLNFAIPVELLRIILPALYDGGKILHPWIGAYGKTAALPGSAENAGVSLVYSVPGGPSFISGIPADAIITAINGKPVKTLEELQDLIIREQPGTIVRLTAVSGEDAKGELVYKDWFVMLDERPEVPGDVVFDLDLESRAFLPIFGMKLERVGRSSQYTVTRLVRGSIADESGFSEQDVIEIRTVKLDKENEIVTAQLLTKRREKGYLDAFIGLSASLDSPSYF